MGIYLSAEELAQLDPAVTGFRSPVPTQIVSNGEFNPLPQTPQQQQVEARIKELPIHTVRNWVWIAGNSCAPVVAWRQPLWRSIRCLATCST